MILYIINLFAGIIFFLLPGFLFVHILLHNSSLTNPAEKTFFSLIASLTLTPIFFFYLSFSVNLPINQNLIFWGQVFLSLTFFVIYRLSTPQKPQKILKTIKKNTEKLIKDRYHQGAILLFSILAIGLFYGYFIKSFTITGADTPVYLYKSTQVLLDQNLKPELDRHIIYILPVILTYLTGASIETIFKLLFFTVFLLYSLAIFLFTYRFSKGFWPHIATLFLVTSLSTATLQNGMFANLSAFLVVHVVVHILTLWVFSKHKETNLAILAALLLGSTFNLHGIISYAQLFILIIPTLSLLFLNRDRVVRNIGKTTKLFILFFSLMLVTGLPLLGHAPYYLNEAVHKLILPPSDTTQTTRRPQDPLSLTTPSAFTSIASAPSSKRPILHQTKYFTSNYQSIILVLALLGLVVSITRNLPARKHQPYIFVSLVTLSIFLATQQAHLGISWFPSRFVLGIGFFVAFYSVFFLEKIYNLNTNKKLFSLIFITAVTLFVCYRTYRGLSNLNDLAEPNIEKSTYQFLKNLPDYINNKKAPIYMHIYEYQWAVGLNPGLNIKNVNLDYVCNPSVKSQINVVDWVLAEAFCSDTELEKSLVTFSELSHNQPYYIVYQPNAFIPSAHLFDNPYYRRIHQHQDIYIYYRD